MDDNSATAQRKKLTEQLLRKKYSDITDFYHACDHVVLYIYENNEWQSTGTEGSMHIVKTNSPPFHKLIICNRKSTKNFTYSFDPQKLDIQQQIPYVLFRSTDNQQDKNTYGLWFYNKVHAITAVDIFFKLGHQAFPPPPPQNHHRISGPPPSHHIPLHSNPPQTPQPLAHPTMMHISDMSNQNLTQLLKKTLNIFPGDLETSIQTPVSQIISQDTLSSKPDAKPRKKPTSKSSNSQRNDQPKFKILSRNQNNRDESSKKPSNKEKPTLNTTQLYGSSTQSNKPNESSTSTQANSSTPETPITIDRERFMKMIPAPVILRAVTQKLNVSTSTNNVTFKNKEEFKHVLVSMLQTENSALLDFLYRRFQNISTSK